mmetsp:Transcript_45117/g.76000  ORF Transcript_45117/g.76000 Transcript_45117/m.76000 type:complete len:213 (-) Transcript_45117:254-892(-)
MHPPLTLWAFQCPSHLVEQKIAPCGTARIPYGVLVETVVAVDCEFVSGRPARGTPPIGHGGHEGLLIHPPIADGSERLDRGTGHLCRAPPPVPSPQVCLFYCPRTRARLCGARATAAATVCLWTCVRPANCANRKPTFAILGNVSTGSRRRRCCCPVRALQMRCSLSFCKAVAKCSSPGAQVYWSLCNVTQSEVSGFSRKHTLSVGGLIVLL